VTDAGGAVTDYSYDPSGNLMSVTAPSNNDAGTRPVTAYTYDSVGRVNTVTDALTKVTTYTYDALDRIKTVTLPPPSTGSPLIFTTSYSYDNYDAPTTFTFTNVTDPNAIVTKQGYDQFGRLRKSIDGLGNGTAYGYTRNLLTAIVDANNNTTTYTYDALKRLSATVFPDSLQETYTYYSDGLLKTKTDRKNQTITYGYDSLKRLTSKAYPNATSVQYAYTGQKLAQVTDTSVSPTETHTFGYDDRFRTISNGQASRATIAYTYDSTDRTATMTLAGGPVTSYAYYPDGSLNTITWSAVTGTFKYAYTPRGQYASITYPNNQSRSFTYDDQGRLLQLANTHPTTGNVATFAYGYDLDNPTSTYIRLGQRSSMTADVPSQSLSAAVSRYNYDANYQLTGVTYPAAAPFNGDVSSWTYDAIGNRTSATTNGTTTTYGYQKIGSNPLNWQRLLTAGSATYTYDSNGNTSTMSGNTYTPDYENRLKNISGSVTSSYQYDYQGRRASKSVGGTTTYVYDGLNLIREIGVSTNDYLFGPGIDELLAMSSGGTVSYYAVDGLSSVATVNDAAGSAQNNYAYDTWGAQRTTTETLPQPFRYTSREAGDLSGQLFYRARYYQSDTGRFLSEDPLRTIAGPNFYAYVLNRPLSYTDPAGLSVFPPVVIPPPAPDVTLPSPLCIAVAMKWVTLSIPALRPQEYDKYLHCIAGCEIGKACGTQMAVVAAFVKEWLDANGAGTYDPADALATATCSDTSRSCRCCCKSAGYTPQGPTPISQ
jgi:RHS repeat-associated protein